jgi:hypothetical protein
MSRSQLEHRPVLRRLVADRQDSQSVALLWSSVSCCYYRVDRGYSNEACHEEELVGRGPGSGAGGSDRDLRSGHGRDVLRHADCRACKNCRYCKHCAKEGGTCGVCKRQHARDSKARPLSVHQSGDGGKRAAIAPDR